jgi:uncharacterized membrane protein YkvA (DUF1232 family)
MSDKETAEKQVAVLQRFVNSYPDDLRSVLEAMNDSDIPEEALRVLVGGLAYGLDMLDMFPDHYKGIGIADDAIILRVAAKQATAAGATQMGLAKLANEAKEVADVVGELYEPLTQLVEKLPDREVRGRTAEKVLSHKDTRISFEADVTREARRHTPQPIEMTGGPERAIIELRKMMKHGLKKAGLEV